MSIVAITGDHPRHSYLVSVLGDAGLLSGWVREVREAFVPMAPANLSDATRALFNLHFQRREKAEERFFEMPERVDLKPLEVPLEDLNSQRVAEYIAACAPRLVISYGCHKLSPELRNSVDATFWNTHGGLSPDYRGVITHFWPSYMLEPQMTGVTLHETTDSLDGGRIIHQTGAALARGDGLHDLAARSVKHYADEVGPLLQLALAEERLPEGIAQKSEGKLWLMRDWRPEHLHLVYDTYGDCIVDHLLDGEIEGRDPRLTSVLR